jgi:hypothetical protein
MASSFETHRFAMLLRVRSQTLMVRSASEFIIGPRFARTRWRVSNHEAKVHSLWAETSEARSWTLKR